MSQNTLSSHLLDLNATSANIEASAIISKDGMVIASALPQGMNEDNVGAMTAAMLSVGNRGTKEFAGGALEQILVKGAQGYILMTQAGKEAILTVIAKPTAKLDLAMLELKHSAEKLTAFI